VEVRFCDESELGFGWIAAEPASMQRTSHALVADGAVWVVDPVDGPGVEERIRALGDPRGVLMLLDRHRRDCRALAERLSVPLHETPFEGVEGAPFSFLPVIRNRLWREVALWWEQRRLLLVPEAIGTTPLVRAPGERAGVHPALRLRPPRRQLGGLAPERLLVGHGEGVQEEAAAALRDALAGSRRRTPAWAGARLRGLLRRRRDPNRR
jgi:hypothetical protein